MGRLLSVKHPSKIKSSIYFESGGCGRSGADKIRLRLLRLLCDGKGDIRRQECLPARSLLVDRGGFGRGGELDGKKTQLNIHLLDDQRQKESA